MQSLMHFVLIVGRNFSFQKVECPHNNLFNTMLFTIHFNTYIVILGAKIDC